CTIIGAAQHFKGFLCTAVSRAFWPVLDGHGLAEARTDMDDFPDQAGRRRRGLLIVLSSPSGAGKSTISRMLLDTDDEVTMSISATTRPKRPGEAEDVDYHFVDDAE